MAVLAVQGLTKHFGGIIACQDLTFAVEEEEILGIIGPNGAGKTTVFNLITGIYPPTKGSMLFREEDIGGKSPDLIVKKGIARTFQSIRLFRNLSVLENVVIAIDQKNVLYSLGRALVRAPGVTRSEKKLREMAHFYLETMGLAGKESLRADSLPYGLQRKLEIARALALEPTLLLLDEPAAGMNPEESIELAELVRRVKNEFRLTVLLIEHHMDVVMELCDRIVVMNFGEKLAEGDPEEIQADPAVLKAYLGEGYKRA